MVIVDTHSHLFVEEFEPDRAEVLERACAAGVSRILMPNINKESLPAMLQMCQQYPQLCFPMIGLHPTEIQADYRETLSFMHQCLLQPNAFIAIGEVGLDFYWSQLQRAEQLEVFEEQIKWASEFNLPLVIHARSAFKELCEILAPYRRTSLKGVFHSFTGTADEAIALLDFSGFYLGINGVVTFKKSTLPEALQHVPLERVVVETDSPYLAPVPYRGKRNESAYIIEVVRRLAQIYNCLPETVAKQTTRNACDLFFPLDTFCK